MTAQHNSPTAIVIFGGTGDLAQTKLLPALFELYMQGALPDAFVIVGLSRKELTDEAYRLFVKDSVTQKNPNYKQHDLDAFSAHIRYVSGNFDILISYEKIKTVLQEYDDSIQMCTNKLFYLAVPPQYYETIFTHLHKSEAMALCDGIGSWSRLLVEKPFGKDLETALFLEKQLCSLFADEQVYRIDHYLAKDSIENIISLRFANTILSDSWNKERIESIEVRLLETKDVANRGSFYDGIGTLRDVGQNHMLQILALLTMSAVDVHDAQAVRTARAQALLELLEGDLEAVSRGQYLGYVDTPGVDDSSVTETYFALSLLSSTSQWQGVRFTLEAGKALDLSVNEAIVTFKSLDMCRCAYSTQPHTHKNTLRITFSPEQRMSLSMWTKKPGFDFELEEQELELLHTASTDTYSPEAYERVLFDCIRGDQTRFVSGAEVEAAWRFITPILELFKTLPLHQYEPGSKGPIITTIPSQK